MNLQRRPAASNKRLVVFFLIFLASVLLMKGISVPSTAQSTEERELEDKIPKHLPIKVKIKKEKEKAFKDLNNEKWLRDFELEVTNTGNKPIYFLDLLIILPEIKGSDGNNLGFSLYYGRGGLGNLENKAGMDDVPIKPGETYVFKIHKNQVLGWEDFVEKEKGPQPKKLILHFLTLSFGDGTGFLGNSGVPFPYAPNEKSSTSPCLREPNRSPRDINAQRSAKDDLPARFLLANFLSTELSHPISLKLNLRPQDCCSGSGCFRSKPHTDEEGCYSCGPRTMLDNALCGDSSAACYKANYVTIRCRIPETGEMFSCNQTDFDLCGSPTPTPSPSPSTSPTPPPTAENCPLTYSSNCPDGPPVDPCYWGDFNQGCPSRYEREGNCCKLIPCPSPTPTPPACGGTLTWDGYICDWRCIVTLSQGDNCEPGMARNCINSRGQWNSEDCSCTYPTGRGDGGTCLWCTSPILVDTSGDGFRLTDAEGGVSFDLNHDGTPELLSWTATYSNDAFLALDRNSNGRIDNGAELFGDSTLQPTSDTPNGFLALAVYDQTAYGGNGDRLINSQDAVFQFLSLWLDGNHNGASEPGELFPLTALRVESISLDYKEAKRVDQFGNQFRYRAKVDDSRHSRVGRWAWDVFLAGVP